MSTGMSIYEWTSTSVQTDKTGKAVVFKTANNATTTVADPLYISSTGVVFSYTKMLRMRLAMPSTAFSGVNNLRFYTDGSNNFGSGVGVFCRASTWQAPTLTPSSSVSANAFVYVSTAPLALSTGTFGSSVYSSTQTADIGRFVNIYCTCTTAASRGAKSAETVTWSYDET